MGEVVFARVDERLIHGQIMTAIAPSSGANLIILCDDKSTSDPFMKSIHESTGSSKGMKTRVLTIEETINHWEENQFGNNKVLLITQTIETMYKLVKAGIVVKSINVGGKSKKPGTVTIINEVSITHEEFEILKELNVKYNAEVYVQALPSNKKVDYSGIAKRFND